MIHNMATTTEYRKVVEALEVLEARASECARSAMPAYGQVYSEGDQFIVQDIQKELVIVRCIDCQGRHLQHIQIPANVITGERSKRDWINELVILENKRRIKANTAEHKRLVAAARVKKAQIEMFLGREDEIPDAYGTFASTEFDLGPLEIP